MEFDSNSFLGLTHTEQIAKCRASAVEAERLARAANGETRDGYFDLAKRWFDLANEMTAAG